MKIRNETLFSPFLLSIYKGATIRGHHISTDTIPAHN